MIGWLNGKRIDSWTKGTKKGVLVSCSGVGYEVQILPRENLRVEMDQDLTLWIHQIVKEDRIMLFGFQEKIERNLFRKLIEINGIGPQIAISLLEKYESSELIFAIKNADTDTLSSVSGVGKRIAERIIIELKEKLNEIEFKTHITEEDALNNSGIDTFINYQKELKAILHNLNYEESEINQALKAIQNEKNTMDLTLEKGSNELNDKELDTYLKEALVWLSQDLATKGT